MEKRHGQARSITKKTIYLSPSVEYADHPVDSQLVKLGRQDHGAQLVYQCRVRPGAFREEKGSLGGKHWDKDVAFDPKFRSLADDPLGGDFY